VSIALLLLALVCLIVWVFVVGPRVGRLLAVPAVAGTLLLVFVGLLLLTPLVPIPLGIVVLAVLAAATAAGFLLLVRSPPAHRRPSRGALVLWLPATVGALGWLAVRALSFVVQDASRVSWAMEGDATNNLFLARQIVHDNGIVLGSDQNPVPFAAGLVAIPLSIEGVGNPGGSLETDLWVFAAVWTVLLAACCIAAGVVAASVVDPRRPTLVGVAGAAGSLLPLTWFVAGLPIEYGYLNVHVVFPLLLASWLAYLGAARAPAVALVALVSLSALILVTWSPVTLIPVALGILVVVRHPKSIFVAHRRTALVPVVAVALFLVFALGLTVPAFFSQAEALEAPGHGYPATWLLSAALALGTLAAAALLRTRIVAPVFAGTVAVVAASYAALASTFYVSRDLFDPWNGYYPVKLVWLIAALMLPVSASLLFAAGARLERRALRATAAALAAVLIVGLAAAPPVDTPAGYIARQPAERILGGHVWQTGDAAVDVIVALSARDEIGILWESASSDEALVNYWALDAAGADLEGDEALRRFAFKEYGAFRATGSHDAFSTNALCALLRDPSRELVIYTDNPALEGEFAENCTGASADFRVGETPGVAY